MGLVGVGGPGDRIRATIRVPDDSRPGQDAGAEREDPERRLNELGREGFELVDRIEQQFGGTQMLILMREVPE